jgi:hypothetical protein
MRLLGSLLTKRESLPLGREESSLLTRDNVFPKEKASRINFTGRKSTHININHFYVENLSS